LHEKVKSRGKEEEKAEQDARSGAHKPSRNE
jgi:hypothetical protein